MSESRNTPRTIEPTEDERRLRVVWGDGHVSEYEPRYLRLQCPCASCVDEMSGRPILRPEAVPPDVYPLAINYVGRYAIKFQWSDGHQTGIYAFDHLRRVCPCADCSGDDGAGTVS